MKLTKINKKSPKSTGNKTPALIQKTAKLAEKLGFGMGRLKMTPVEFF